VEAPLWAKCSDMAVRKEEWRSNRSSNAAGRCKNDDKEASGAGGEGLLLLVVEVGGELLPVEDSKLDDWDTGDGDWRVRELRGVDRARLLNRNTFEGVVFAASSSCCCRCVADRHPSLSLFPISSNFLFFDGDSGRTVVAVMAVEAIILFPGISFPSTASVVLGFADLVKRWMPA
jgi:hypothetical protein